MSFIERTNTKRFYLSMTIMNWLLFMEFQKRKLFSFPKQKHKTEAKHSKYLRFSFPCLSFVSLSCIFEKKTQNRMLVEKDLLADL